VKHEMDNGAKANHPTPVCQWLMASGALLLVEMG